MEEEPRDGVGLDVDNEDGGPEGFFIENTNHCKILAASLIYIIIINDVAGFAQV